MNIIDAIMIFSVINDITLPIIEHAMALTKSNRLIMKFRVADLSKTWFNFSMVSDTSNNMLELEII